MKSISPDFYEGKKLLLEEIENLTDGGVTTLHQHETTEVMYPASLIIGTPTHVTHLQSLLDHSWGAGITDGCNITDNGNGTISISTGNAILRAAADPHSALYNVEVIPQLNIALTDNATNYVYLSYNAGVPTFLVSTAVTACNGMDKILVWMIHRLGIVLHSIDVRNLNVDTARKTAHMFLAFARFIHAAGGSVLGNPSTLAISLTSGHFYFMLNEIEHDAFDTSVAGTANVNVFNLWHRDGIGGWTDTIEQKLVNTLYYDDGTGTPALLGNNKFGTIWFYIVNDTPSELHAVLGQTEYPNAFAAGNAIPPSTVPTILEGLGVLVGFVTFEKAAIAFTAVRSAFSTAFGSSAATSHNGLGGIQGGAVNEYYHLSLAERDKVVQLDSLSLEAGESLVVGDPVYVSVNKFYKADSTTNPTVVGIISVAALATFIATATIAGKITLSGLTAGSPYFLASPSSISTTAPSSGYIIRLGRAVSTTVLLLNIEEPILLT